MRYKQNAKENIYNISIYLPYAKSQQQINT